MTELQTIGYDIFRKYVLSCFVDTAMANQWLASAKTKAGQEIEHGFYLAEQEWMRTHPEYPEKKK